MVRNESPRRSFNVEERIPFHTNLSQIPDRLRYPQSISEILDGSAHLANEDERNDLCRDRVMAWCCALFLIHKLGLLGENKTLSAYNIMIDGFEEFLSVIRCPKSSSGSAVSFLSHDSPFGPIRLNPAPTISASFV
jgi:hypothetical protein